MKTLYLDNFRGFKNSFIPLAEVNFLVGENSTGKSSLLSILKLMSSTIFWRSGDFNTEEVELGVFDELASLGYRDSVFKIGYLNDEGDSFSFQNIVATYRNKKGTPELVEIRTFVENRAFEITTNTRKLKYKVKDFDVNLPSSSLDDFKALVKEDFSGEKLKVFTSEERTEASTFLNIRRIIKAEIPKEKSGSTPFSPQFLENLRWIAPIRTKPKRIYESFKLIYSAEGNHTPLLIKNILNNNTKKTITKLKFQEIMQEFGKASNLFDKIEIESFGKGSASPFVINIFLNNKAIKITNVGYGVGQVLPVLAEILVGRSEQWFAIQQPEVHLHPKAQAALGEFIHTAAKEKDQKFIIETHSDFIIDRFRMKLRRRGNFVESQVLYFERKEGENHVTSIPFAKDGNFAIDPPRSFRDFFIKEELDLLSI